MTVSYQPTKASFRLPPAIRLGLLAGILLTKGFGANAGSPAYNFQFGSGPAVPDFLQVAPDTTYSADRGYGFDLGSSVHATSCTGDTPLHSGCCTSERPFYFSVRLPEGNYDVTVTLGDGAGGSTNCVKAESRRLMLEDVRTAPGQFATRTFTVSVEDIPPFAPEHPDPVNEFHIPASASSTDLKPEGN